MRVQISQNKHWFSRVATRFAALTVLSAATLLGQPALANGHAHPMMFDRITIEDGLSQSSVISIVQDSDGLMWFGTENGLNRFDGYEFQHVLRERGSASVLRNDFIYAVTEAADGGLWLGTNGGGLAHLDRATKTVTTYTNNPNDVATIAGNVVRAVLKDSDGKLWLGLRNAGLDRFDPATGTVEHIEIGGAKSVYTLLQDSTGVVWVGTDSGLFQVDPVSLDLRHFQHNESRASSLSGDRIRSIFEDADGVLWIGTRTSGLNRFDRDSSSFTRFRHVPGKAGTLSNDRVTAILEDDGGRLWVGTADGLNLMDRDNGSFVTFRNVPSDAISLSSSSIAALYQDRGGILWVGTLTGGVSKWNPKTWTLGLRESVALEDDVVEVKPSVTSMTTDATGRLWIGTFGDGLIAENRETGDTVRYRHDPENPASLSGDRVMSLMFDREGMLWVGTMASGLNRFNPETGANTVFRHDPENSASLAADGVMAIFEDSEGLVWIGTFGGGISIYDPTSASFSRIQANASVRNGLSSNRVTAFVEDANGNLWIGTDAGGLSLYNRDSGKFSSYRYDAADPRSLSDDTVYSLHIDAEGTVWVGTRGGGLDRVLGDSERPETIRFANLSQRDGLSNNVVYGVQSDVNGELWLSTNYGISRYNPESGEIATLHRRDGLQSEEFNFGAHHRSASGELFFGGYNGFNAFKPEAIAKNSIVPAVILTGFFKNGDRAESDLPVDPDAGIDLGYRDDQVSFEFAALDYASPEANRYMYKLEGFDENWIDLGNRRRVTYTDLAAGSYLLRVKAANADGVWNEAGFALPVHVEPAPWATWWAYLGYFAAAIQCGLFLWWAHQRKLRREEEYSHRLELEVQQRTIELAERNAELKDLNASLQESSLSDPLTGLKNRRFVFEEVSRELDGINRKYEKELEGYDTRDASDLVFMMIDLDNFKPVNDTYGHAAGDKMLLDIRDVLLNTCRRSDFVIRWGGDEFVVIAKQAHAGESEALAERIRESIESHEFQLPEGQVVRSTASIGFTAFPLFRGQADNGNFDDIINVADSLMYEAKRQRNAWVGMLGINDVATSANFDDSDIEASSILFQARRKGQLVKHGVEGTVQRANAG